MFRCHQAHKAHLTPKALEVLFCPYSFQSVYGTFCTLRAKSWAQQRTNIVPSKRKWFRKTNRGPAPNLLEVLSSAVPSHPRLLHLQETREGPVICGFLGHEEHSEVPRHQACFHSKINHCHFKSLVLVFARSLQWLMYHQTFNVLPEGRDFHLNVDDIPFVLFPDTTTKAPFGFSHSPWARVLSGTTGITQGGRFFIPWV